MAQTTVTNNFTKGLITEATGLNFPENAFTSGSNVIPTLVGDITRRQGIDLEPNFAYFAQTPGGNAQASYKWNNAGGDGLTQIVVRQVGNVLFFYQSSNASVNLSSTLITSTVTISQFASQATLDSTIECQFSDGNGYLFVYHPQCEPFYCTYNAGVVTGNIITLQIRDFVGVVDGLAVNSRPGNLTSEHNYNIINQGWTAGVPWQAPSSTLVTVNLGNVTFQTTTGLTIVAGTQVICQNAAPFYFFSGSQYVVVQPDSVLMSGTVVSYSGSSLTINVNFVATSQIGTFAGFNYYNWYIRPSSIGFVNTWLQATGTYPSNADVWWYFKDNTGSFNPSVTSSNVSLNTGTAPQGHFIFSAFNQNRSLISGVSSLTTVYTYVRPRTGTWFQGRVWYAGVDAQFPATGDVNYYTWTENIYFSQVVTTPSDFGSCYQTNDPTAETLNTLLPTDGGVIQIQGAGSIYKLFPIANGMLVFASNGVWFITGSQGIGFSADDYTITKISAVRSISSTSFVDVNGLPYFWNEEGIYMVAPQQGGQLSVEPITVGTILTYYNNIPYKSKQYVRGAYDPINYIIQWTYSSTQTGQATQYIFDTILCYNTFNKAFYPYNISISNTFNPTINGIIYVTYPGGGSSLTSQITYLTTYGNYIQFGYEYSDTYKDWYSTGTPVDYVSTFITGYRVHGNALYKFQMPYVYIYLRNDTSNSYIINGIWDYASSGNSGRWSQPQLITDFNPNYGTTYRRHRIRGKGMALQIQITSQSGLPFDIIGWSVLENVNQGV